MSISLHSLRSLQMRKNKPKQCISGWQSSGKLPPALPGRLAGLCDAVPIGPVWDAAPSCSKRGFLLLCCWLFLPSGKLPASAPVHVELCLALVDGFDLESSLPNKAPNLATKKPHSSPCMYRLLLSISD